MSKLCMAIYAFKKEEKDNQKNIQTKKDKLSMPLL